MKKKDLSQERGQILDVFVTLETCISMIIAKHYFGTQDQKSKELDFQFYILQNSRFNWGLKRDILEHLLRVDNLSEANLSELDRMNSIRNTFAHKQFITNDNPQTPESDVFFPHSRHPFDRARNISAESLKKEFYALFPPVINWLYSLAQTKGVSLPDIKKTTDPSI